MDTKEVERFALDELTVLNGLLRDHGVNAGTHPNGDWTTVAPGHIFYGVTLGEGERIANLLRIQAEMCEAVSRFRKRATPVRVQATPPLGLETPHPAPRALTWPGSTDCAAPHVALMGRRYMGDIAQYETMDLRVSPHALIAAMTGAGKSMLVQAMVLSLCLATPPSELRLAIIDLKQEDLLPLADLPHTWLTAYDLDSARVLLAKVRSELAARLARPGYAPFRLVVVIDELSRLAALKDERNCLSEIAAMGRSKHVNLIAATQLVTEDGGMGQMMKANFTLRIVGRVAGEQAHLASGVKQSGAASLPRCGGWLRIEQGEMFRFQSYLLPERVLRQGIADLGGHLGGHLGGRHAASVVAAPAQREIVPASLSQAFEEWVDETGKLKRGGLAAALRIYVGGDVPVGGLRYQKLRDEVNVLLEKWHSGRVAHA